MAFIPPPPVKGLSHPGPRPKLADYGLTAEELAYWYTFSLDASARQESELKKLQHALTILESESAQKVPPRPVDSIRAILYAVVFGPIACGAIANFLGVDFWFTYLAGVIASGILHYACALRPYQKFAQARLEITDAVAAIEQEKQRDARNVKLRAALSYLADDNRYERIESEYRRIKTARLFQVEAAHRLWQEREALKQQATWKSLGGYEFEEEIGKLLRQHQFDVTVTPKSGDGGVDLIAKRRRQTVIVQCKGHQRPVGIATLRELYGVRDDFFATGLVVATYSGVAKSAADWARNKCIEIWDVGHIAALASGEATISDTGQIRIMKCTTTRPTRGDH